MTMIVILSECKYLQFQENAHHMNNAGPSDVLNVSLFAN